MSFRGGRGRGRGGGPGGRGGGVGDLSIGTLTYADILATERAAATAELWSSEIEPPDTRPPDAQEKREAKWSVEVAMGRPRGGRWWVDTSVRPKASRGRGQSVGKAGAEQWMYSDRYKVQLTGSSGGLLQTAEDKALLNKAFFPPDLWAGYFEGKGKKRKAATRVARDKKPKLDANGEILAGIEEDEPETKDEEEEEAGGPDEEEEEEEEDADYDNNYFDNGEGDESGGEGGDDDGGVY